ncbi:MAG: integration host factor subunit beta [Phycisphaerae bacterium]|nr:integration host factor subunit beta [Phycisphaerae bacterium]
MHTITKKELVDRIADQTKQKRVVVKKVVQQFLDEIIDELGRGNRLEFRDFGVFETKERAARMAQNPKTLERVHVPPKRTVKFKVGRMMKAKLSEEIPSLPASSASEAPPNASAPPTPGMQ